MILLTHNNTDPRLNLALEEVVLRSWKNDVVFLWHSDASVVVGKHQNAHSEVNNAHVAIHDIPVIRRLSGGGTVFHGPGNLNYTFIEQGESGRQIDFKKHTAPAVEFLQTMGLDARFEGKNDLRANGLKISGNAAHVYKNRVLHHGTLLFDARLNDLRNALEASPHKYKDRSVQSVRSPVANIAALMERPMTFSGFSAAFIDFLVQRFHIQSQVCPDPDTLAAAHKLVEEKYDRWEWNFGYSPPYEFNGEATTKSGNIEMWMKVEKGIIVDSRVGGDVASTSWQNLPFSIEGKQHREQVILNALKENDLAADALSHLPYELFPLFF